MIGLMSGTSIDAVDACCVKLWQDNGKLRFEILANASRPVPLQLKHRLLSVMTAEPVALKELGSLDNAVGILFSEVARDAVSASGLKRSDITAISSHGQTIFHFPPPKPGIVGHTLQIGNAPMIAEQLEIPVISNFRKRDMAVGGQGAPLVCFADQILFQDEAIGRGIQNIGGIANVTVLPSKNSGKDIFAFDTGPGNMMIDAAMQVLLDKPYDANGDVAASGKVDSSLLAKLMDNPYFDALPPKSTGRELFGVQYAQDVLNQNDNLPKENLIATLTQFTANTLVDAYCKFVFPTVSVEEVVLGGGGVNNLTLKRMILEGFAAKGHKISLKTHQDFGVPDQYKEALAFAILGWASLHRIPSNVQSCTGADRAVILGCLDF
jgi:anhydro-N-acetylmuramic acid kinase